MIRKLLFIVFSSLFFSLISFGAVDRGLVAHWLANQIVGQELQDQIGESHARVRGKIETRKFGQLEGLLINRDQHRVIVPYDRDLKSLPRKTMTVEAWVNIEKTVEWGGIVGAVKDDRGWLLGTRQSSFSFGVNGKDSSGFTHVRVRGSLEWGKWYHVVGTYDGQVIQIYVDGHLENGSEAQVGEINYAQHGNYVIGAFENFYPRCWVHEIRIYDRALDNSEIIQQYASKSPLFPPVLSFVTVPHLRRINNKTAIISWETGVQTPSILYIGDDLPLAHKVADLIPKTNHNITLNDIESKKIYHYRVEVDDQSSRLYEFDSTFDYSKVEMANIVLPPRQDKYARMAGKIVEECGVKQGYCLVLGADQGQLVLELVKRTDLQIICVDPDLKNIEQARKTLDVAGVYGIRSSIHRASFKKLSYVDYFANLIVVRERNVPIEEILRLLRPAGGIAYIRDVVGLPRRTEGFNISPSKLEGWQIIRRGKLPGSGVWSHQYGDPANTTCSQDQHPRDPMRVLWFGQPGPRTMVDRGTHVSAPLSVNGRLYIQGDRRLFGLDAYNGTILWAVDVPDMRRANIPRDSGNMVADGDRLYVAVKDKCWKINGNSGEIVALFDQVTPDHEWGYVAYAENQLFGSSVKKGGIYVGADGEWYDKSNEESQKVVSENLFAVDPVEGNEIWRYDASGARIINSTITIGGGRVYFVESRNPQLVVLGSGRFGHELVEDRIMVALDVGTGRKIWEKPYVFQEDSWVFFLSYADEVLISLITSSKYHLSAFDAKNGEQIWNQEYGWGRDHHGGAMYHPLIIGNEVYAEPKVFDLKTGRILLEKMPDRGGCNTMSASATALFYRDSYHGMWDLQQNKRHKWTGLRPGCSLGTISAGGIVLSPESSAGCYCSYPIQTSIAFLPDSVN